MTIYQYLHLRVPTVYVIKEKVRRMMEKLTLNEQIERYIHTPLAASISLTFVMSKDWAFP